MTADDTRWPTTPYQTKLPFSEKGLRPTFHYDEPGWDDRLIEAKVDALFQQGFQLPRNRYPLLKGYNGATGAERRKGGGKWKAALMNGLVPQPTECSVCGSGKSVQSHNEVYARPLCAKPICSRCHRALHRRFYDPDPWLALAREFQYEGAWFRNIALHELTREQMLHLATLHDPLDVRQLGYAAS